MSLILLHAVLDAAGLGGLGCPFRTLTTIPCPGCGLGTAAHFAIEGEWGASFTAHPFLAFFVLGIGVIAAGALLPDGPRARFIARFEAFEEPTGAITCFSGVLFAYWILRLLLMAGSH